MPTHLASFSFARIGDYLELTKPRLVSLVILSTAVGFFLASGPVIQAGLFLTTIIGTLLVAAGSMTLNEWMEHRYDAKMRRTASRPIPSGRLKPQEAFGFGFFLSVSGFVMLAVGVNFVACFLAALTSFSYLLCYTPLKRKTSLCTIVGAIPGALPPLIGWAAVSGAPSYAAWVLFAIIFLWQMPHFLAIAWLYRSDFEKAGFRMLSVYDPTGEQVIRQMVLYSLALLPVSLLPSVIGLTGALYFFAALAMGIGFCGLGVLSFRRLEERARMLFRASVIYLTLLFIVMVIDKV